MQAAERRSTPGLVLAAIAMLLVPIGLSLVAPSGIAHWVVPGSAAAIAVVAFLLWPVRGLVIFALYVLFIDTISLVAGADIKLVDELTIPVIGLITLVRQHDRIREAILIPRDVAVVVIIAAGVLSSLVDGVGASIWAPGLLLLVKGIAIFYIARLLLVTDADVRWTARVVLAVGVVVLALGFVELVAPSVFTSIGLRPSDERAGLPAIKSLFYHQQLFGWFCAFIALYLFAGHVILRRRWMLALALLFSLGTILSARRRAILGLVAGLAVGILTGLTGPKGERWPMVRRWIPSSVGVLVLVVAFLPALAGLYQMTVEGYGTQEPGVTVGPGGVTVVEPPDTDQVGAPARLALLETSVKIAVDRFPLGAGLGRFGSWISRTHYSDVYAEYGLDRVFGLSPQNPQFITDTTWPQILGETGVIGLAGYCVFLASLGFSLWRVSRRTDLAPLAVAIVLGTGLIFAQTLVESLASPIVDSPSQIYLIMACIGGVLAWTYRPWTTEASSTSSPVVAPPTADAGDGSS